jgi:hypothetical protein
MVHHPSGRPKQLALRQNLLIKSSDAELWYATETASATSGAPIFNDSWQVVALHRGGAPARDRTGRILTTDGEPWIEGGDETRIVWRACVGSRASAILSRLVATSSAHPLIVELVGESERDANEAIVIPLGAGAGETPLSLGETPNGEAIDAMLRATRTTTSPPPTNGGAAHDGNGPADSVTVTVPLRITVRQGNGSSRAPAVGVDLS